MAITNKKILYSILLNHLVNSKIIVFENYFQKNDTVHIFNHVRYRESIHSKYALGLKDDNYNIQSNFPYTIYEGKINYGKYQLRDYDITQKWTKIDEIDIYLPKNQIIYILSQITMKNNYDYFYTKIMDNGKVIYSTFDYYMDHLDIYPMFEGYHKLGLYTMASDGNIHLRPSMLDGFKHSYQFVCWINHINDVNMSNSTDNDDQIAVNLTSSSNDYLRHIYFL